MAGFSDKNASRRIGAFCNVSNRSNRCVCFAPKAQHSAPAWGGAPGFVEPQNNVSAESAIHFCPGLRNHLLN
jgi:hypothetical protein